MKIFLDDVRNPKDCLGYMYQRIGNLNPIYDEDWVIVRNYEQFKLIVGAAYERFITITHISFDHDLGEDVATYLRESGLSKRKARQSKKEVKSGYDCAKWFIEYYEGFGDNPPVPFPTIFVHSTNPVGRQNIENLFK
jgi:hypothetical protein